MSFECMAATATVNLDVHGTTLSVTPPQLPGLERRSETDDQLKAWWSGAVGGSSVIIELRVYPRGRYSLDDPEDVVKFLGADLADPGRGGDQEFEFDSREVLQGPFGWAPYASLAAGTIPNRSKATGEVLALGAVLERHAYSVMITSKPPLSGEFRGKALEFLRSGIATNAKSYDPGWTADEIRARMDRDVPDPRVRDGFKKPIRTKHYLILTNSSAGALFAKKMEEAYAKIQKVFPFPEEEGRRLMPVFVFRTAAQYVDYYVHVSECTREEAQGSKGHAWKDYYATHYDAANDPVHIHEATHQIFRNRLRFVGGGSWFHEGCAEYMCTIPNDRKGFARNAARQRKFFPFREFFAIRELANAPIGDTWSHYWQAASIIHFLRDGKWQAEKFLTFVTRIGNLPKDDGASAEAVIRSVYGVDIEGLEKEWVKYWANS